MIDDKGTELLKYRTKEVVHNIYALKKGFIFDCYSNCRKKFVKLDEKFNLVKETACNLSYDYLACNSFNLFSHSSSIVVVYDLNLNQTKNITINSINHGYVVQFDASENRLFFLEKYNTCNLHLVCIEKQTILQTIKLNVAKFSLIKNEWIVTYDDKILRYLNLKDSKKCIEVQVDRSDLLLQKGVHSELVFKASNNQAIYF
jgi:hypothetical protein